MSVRTLAVVVALVPALAFSQTSPQEMMLQGIYKIGQANKVTLTTVGTEYRGGKQVDVKVTAALYYDGINEDIRMEVLSFEAGKLVSRQAADGSRLWDFNARANTFTSSDYKDAEGALYRNWKQRVFQTLRLRTSGATAFTLRFLDDVFGTGLASGTWSPWIPTATLTRSGSNFTATASSPNSNTTTYFFSGDDDAGFSFLGAEYVQLFNRGGVEKDWTMTVETGTLPSDTDFRFIPPRGAKAVAVDSRTGG